MSESTPSAEPQINSASNIRRQFATVQLTLLSVVVALILENLMGVMIGMEQRSFVVWLQGVDVLMSAFSMWVGYTFAFMVGDKRPHITDFITPFALLVFLHLAAVCIATGNMSLFFLAGAFGTSSAALNLWASVNDARRRGGVGPVSTAWLLTACCLTELLGAALYALWDLPIWVAIVILVINTAFQFATSLQSISGWVQLSQE